MKLSVLNKAGEDTGKKVDLNKDIFGLELKKKVDLAGSIEKQIPSRIIEELIKLMV